MCMTLAEQVRGVKRCSGSHEIETAVRSADASTARPENIIGALIRPLGGRQLFRVFRSPSFGCVGRGQGSHRSGRCASGKLGCSLELSVHYLFSRLHRQY